MRSPRRVCVSPIQLLNQMTDLYEIWYECYAAGGPPQPHYF